MPFNRMNEADVPAMNTALPKFLKQDEAAKLLRKPPRWLERKRCEGGGPPFRYIGRTPLYELNDVLAWIAAQPLVKHTTHLLDSQDDES